MNKEKQIQEMAHMICSMASKPKSCRECGGRKSGCFTLSKMEILYNAGYRKQSDVAEGIFEDIKKNMTPYWGNILCVDRHISETEIDKLKKKYTEETKESKRERKPNKGNGRGIVS